MERNEKLSTVKIIIDNSESLTDWQKNEIINDLKNVFFKSRKGMIFEQGFDLYTSRIYPQIGNMVVEFQNNGMSALDWSDKA